jgi:hypothetical protein
VSQLSATACCRNKATRPALNADFIVPNKILSR